MKRGWWLIAVSFGCTPEIDLPFLNVPTEADGTMVVAIQNESQSTVCGGPPGFGLQITHPSDRPHRVTALYYDRPGPRLPIDGIDQCPMPTVSDDTGRALPEPDALFETQFEDGRYTEWTAVDQTVDLAGPLPRFRSRDVACPRFTADALFDLDDFDTEAGVSLLARGPGDRLLFATDKGHVGYLVDGQPTLRLQPLDANLHYTAALLAPSGTLWMGRVDGSIVAVNPQTLEQERVGRPSEQAFDRVIEFVSEPDGARIWALLETGKIAGYTEETGWVDVFGRDGLTSRERSLTLFNDALFDTAAERCEECENTTVRIHRLTGTSTRAEFEPVPNADKLLRIRTVDGRLIALGRNNGMRRFFYERVGPGQWPAESLVNDLVAYFDLVPLDGGFVFGGGQGQIGYHDLVYNQTCTLDIPPNVSADMNWMIRFEDLIWAAHIGDEVIFATRVTW